MDQSFSADEKRLIALWERHMTCEFAARDAPATVATMADENYVNHVPVMTGGRGRAELLEFYGRHFIPKMPADTQIVPICRTVGQERLIDEMIIRFTHDMEMDWMLPGVAPTGRRVEVPLLVVVQLSGDEIVSERIYWDQASVLVQLGLLDPSSLPVAGVETARKALDPGLPSNELIRRAETTRDRQERDRVPLSRSSPATDRATGPFDLSTTPIHVGSRGGTDSPAVPLPGFGFDEKAFEGYIAEHCLPGTPDAPGRLIMVASTPTNWSAWECHTEGDEIVIVLEGRAEFIQEIGGEERRTAVRPGSTMINPAGVWHTADVAEPLRAIYITPCPGTQHRAR